MKFVRLLIDRPSEVIQNLLHYYNGQQPPLKGLLFKLLFKNSVSLPVITRGVSTLIF
jgi:hypothetical protein